MFEFEPKKKAEKIEQSQNVQLVRQLTSVFKKLNFNTNIGIFLKSNLLNLSLFEEMEIGVFFIDYRKSSFLFINEALSRMFGVDKETIQRSDIRILESFIHPDDFPKVLYILRKENERLLRMTNTEKTLSGFKIFFRIKQPQGKYCWVMMSKKVVQEGSEMNLINFGTVIRLPEQHAIKRVAGYSSIDNKTTEIIAPNETRGVLNALSPRENEILARVAKGFTSQQISVILDLSLQTVKMHRKHILKKLNVKSSIQAIRMLESADGEDEQMFIN